MEENRTLPVGPERLQEWTRILARYRAGKASVERRIIQAENWWKLRNTTEEDKTADSPRTGFRSRSGWLHNVIANKHADAMEAYPEPAVLPREPGDRQEAQTLSAILPVILEQNQFERTWSGAMWQKLKEGTGCYKVVWDKDKQGGLGDIAVERTNVLNLFWEPGVGDIQHSRYLFHTELMDGTCWRSFIPSAGTSSRATCSPPSATAMTTACPRTASARWWRCITTWAGCCIIASTWGTLCCMPRRTRWRPPPGR